MIKRALPADDAKVLKGSRTSASSVEPWLWLTNPRNLRSEQQADLDALKAKFPDLARLDAPAMAAAAARLVGTHDFASFARPGHGRENTVRTVYGCDVVARANKVIVGVEGSGFRGELAIDKVGNGLGACPDNPSQEQKPV